MVQLLLALRAAITAAARRNAHSCKCHGSLATAYPTRVCVLFRIIHYHTQKPICLTENRADRLKESAEINQKVDEAVNKLDQILESFSTSIATINGGVQLLEAISITMATKEDIAQIAALFQQRVAEGLDQPAGSNKSAETNRNNVRNDGKERR